MNVLEQHGNFEYLVRISQICQSTIIAYYEMIHALTAKLKLNDRIKKEANYNHRTL